MKNKILLIPVTVLLSVCMSSCVFILLDELLTKEKDGGDTYTFINNSTEGIYYSMECVEGDKLAAEDVLKPSDVYFFSSVLGGDTISKYYSIKLKTNDPENQFFYFFVFNRKTILYNSEKDITEKCLYDTCCVYSLKDLMQMDHKIIYNGMPEKQ